MSTSQFHDIGIHFDNGYQSQGLADILAVVMQHQSAFYLPPNLGRQGLLQITAPTEQAGTAAAALMSDALKRVAVLKDREHWLIEEQAKETTEALLNVF